MSRTQEYIDAYDRNIKNELNDKITKQIIITQYSSGITFGDTNDMDTYELEFVYLKLCEMKKEEIEARMKAIKEGIKK